MTADGSRASIRLASYILALLAALLGLHLLGSGGLAPPPFTGGGRALQRWLEARDPAVAAFALMRSGVVIATWYLLGTASAAVVLRMVGAARVASVLDAMSVRPARRLVQAAVGLSLTVSTVGATTALTAPAGLTAATVRRAADEDAVVMQSLPEEEVVMVQLRDDAPAPSTALASDRGSWTVRPGDHFWRIAEEVLTSARGRSPSERETTTYWRRVVEANRSRLVEPNNPDLLIPGQVIDLPGVPAPG